MQKLRMTTWLAALALVVGGCDSTGTPDSGPIDLVDGGGVDAGGDTGTPPIDSGPSGMCSGPDGPCNVFDLTSCGAGMACAMTGGGGAPWVTTCIMPGVGTEGGACTVGTVTAGECQEGYQCGGDGTCVKFCCTSSDCNPGDFCGTLGGADAGLCQTPVGCTLVSPQTGCPDGEGCYPASGGLSCNPAGMIADGDPCMFLNDCMAGSGCLSTADMMGACRRFCDIAAPDCPTDWTCNGITGLDGVGACFPPMPAP